MAKKSDDRSEKHLNWLLRSGANNMKSAKKLFILIQNNKSALSSDVVIQELAQELSSITFSLWRSVFLSDLDGDIADQVADLDEFLGNLISNNTIAYPQDKNTKEFTFRYYLKNAQLRLTKLATDSPNVVGLGWAATGGVGIKNDWIAAQRATDKAIEEFGKMLKLL